jgi:hypothetical protein
LLTV